MMDLWWLIGGVVRLRLTGADPERTLRLLSQELRVEDVRIVSDLVMEFSVPEWKLAFVRQTAERCADRLTVLSRRGLPEKLRAWSRMPLIVGMAAFLLALSLYVPSRILFLRVEGNDTVPSRLILERAEQCGLYFGVSRAALRSEQIKNRLLETIPELSWVGVNTSGCSAVISVRERQEEPEAESSLPGNIVSVTDAVITGMTVTAGTPVCEVGDAVKTGQVLISGYTDLGLCTHVETAEGEIYGMTRRETDAVIPRNTAIPGQNGAVVKKYSLLLGKKRINFYSDSGILHTGCGKMTQIRYLRLPGGWTLPAALIVEVYWLSPLSSAERWEQAARELLEECSGMQTQQAMIAGQILRSEMEFVSGDGVYRMKTLYECREMIGRRSSGILTEGDIQYDGAIGERGAD